VALEVSRNTSVPAGLINPAPSLAGCAVRRRISREGRAGTRTIRTSSGIENRATIVSACQQRQHGLPRHLGRLWNITTRIGAFVKGVSDADDADATAKPGFRGQGTCCTIGLDLSRLFAFCFPSIPWRPGGNPRSAPTQPRVASGRDEQVGEALAGTRDDLQGRRHGRSPAQARRWRMAWKKPSGRTATMRASSSGWLLRRRDL
jgi:hypothetical protein